ncbi:phenylacetic acid degradation bifunctional protein PaaZ [Brevibacterium sp. BRM-1]|uniref:phenylacetic acid degradation bifunctional protein PaaZ n=1 Tax=Brevibacterium sp. BRM-1 TaxID=2999062 RepID=UPI00227DF065|nr:phenylacetic acid degradation bifunctional protein PaaZ [Brevibacterium sp. BRM-1]WAL39703.1 phenylacetic acid degradation bifunctional protein PaaZ [Brevibacterium sp. BRM-1]
MTETAAAPRVDLPDVLPSFVHGGWHEPAEATRASAAQVRDASTGAPVTRVTSAGFDAPATVSYAREAGLPALTALTFHQRGMVLKKLGQHLLERAPEYHRISQATGTTAADAQIDVEGGIGTLLAYSSVARRQMPNDVLMLDGAVERLAKDSTFAGAHVWTSAAGVGVQVNAFNFPVWGMLEKLAPMLVAGRPAIVKPATATAQVTWAVVRDIVDSGLLPDGALQLVCGSLDGLFDELGEQDAIAFTGSAATARTLAASPCVVERGTRFTAEADSLNFSLLGPDARPGAPEFELFVDSLVREMTAKAGQKCTAIRRALVPAGSVAEVREAVCERLAAVVVGDPREAGTTMGPLVSAAQREDVLEAVDALIAAGAQAAVGGREASDELARRLRAERGERDGLSERDERGERAGSGASAGDAAHAADAADAVTVGGAFVAPTLLVAEDPWADAIHDVEAFGPVAVLIGYQDLDEAVRLARRGRGSLVGSVVSHDVETVRTVVMGTAPWHGRLLVLDRDDAKRQTGHGSPLPQLIHGGPGRAGGGEELGGLRGVTHFMQRTALQASPQMLGALTHTWIEGAPRHTDGEHPFALSLSELRLGDAIIAGPRTVTLEDIDHFAQFTGDTFYAHTDEEAARANPFFPGRVAHGYLVVSFAAGLFVWPDPGPVLANYGLENLSFITPVSPGDALTVTLTAKQITPREGSDYGEVRWDAQVVNQDGAPVAAYDVLTLVAKERAGARPS